MKFKVTVEGKMGVCGPVSTPSTTKRVHEMKGRVISNFSPPLAERRAAAARPRGHRKKRHSRPPRAASRTRTKTPRGAPRPHVSGENSNGGALARGSAGECDGGGLGVGPEGCGESCCPYVFKCSENRWKIAKIRVFSAPWVHYSKVLMGGAREKKPGEWEWHGKVLCKRETERP